MLIALILGSFAASVYGVVNDPEVTRLLNSFLNLATLVFLWYMNQKAPDKTEIREHRDKVTNAIRDDIADVKNDVAEVKEITGHAAAAAASAAEVAADAARITKELGGSFRKLDP